MPQSAMEALFALKYHSDFADRANEAVLDWLLLEDSMTRRFEQYCRKVSVEVVFEDFVTVDSLGEDARYLPGDVRFWRREVILYGDGVPWLAGLTLVPESTLSGPELALARLGTTPLGRYLFSSSTLTRDFIDIGRSESLWGRRSLLRLSGKPLLLSELFLPASPLYQEEQKWSGV
ncbi:chorismate pyruvate-lyase [Salmonella enterica subsp. enterica serovar Choleraesuis]|nr:chorismate pyruvate-lyase [Salmonella enterica subsp. enterica serovar Choleraesuis]